MSDPMLPKSVRVEKAVKNTADVFTMTLQSPKKYRFQPGQFNMLYLPGVGEVPISISGSASQGKLIHTIRDVGMVTAALKRLKKNDELGLRGPFGSEWPLEKARKQDVVLVAGGLGLAPLRPAIYHILENRKRYHSVHLIYGCRSQSDLLFQDELKKWVKKINVVTILNHGTPKWKGRVGHVTLAIPDLKIDPKNTMAFLCGPEIMMRFSTAELLKLGIDRSKIYLSLERNMKCAIGFCGHCQLGPHFICKDGPVFSYPSVETLLRISER